MGTIFSLGGGGGGARTEAMKYIQTELFVYYALRYVSAIFL